MDFPLRPTPGREHAEGMLADILAHRERHGLTSRHPYDTLDLDDPMDRRLVGAVHAALARARAARPTLTAPWSGAQAAMN